MKRVAVAESGIPLGRNGIGGFREKADLKETQSVDGCIQGEICVSPDTGATGFNMVACILIHNCPIILLKLSSPFTRCLVTTRQKNFCILWTVYSIGLEYSTVNKYLSRIQKIWVPVPGFLICSVKGLN